MLKADEEEIANFWQDGICFYLTFTAKFVPLFLELLISFKVNDCETSVIGVTQMEANMQLKVLCEMRI